MQRPVSQHRCLVLWPPMSPLRRSASASAAETHRSVSSDMVKCVQIHNKDIRLRVHVGGHNIQPVVCVLWLSAEPQLKDLSSDGLKQLRVAELRNILASWGEECRGCLEKHEFVSLIQEKAPLHAHYMEL